MRARWWCLLLVCVVTANDINRVSVSLLSNWASTPLLLEASEFMQDINAETFWTFLEAHFANSTDHELTDSEDYERILSIAAPILANEVKVDLLKLALSVRFYNPRIAMHRPCDSGIFVVIGGQDCLCNISDLDARIDIFLKELEENNDSPKLPAEHSLGKGRLEIALYGDIRNQKLRPFHEKLIQLSQGGAITYILRHFLVDDNKGKVVLQGYGARLSLKNTEYKATDESEKQGEAQGDYDLSKIDPEEEIHGINFYKLVSHQPNFQNQLLAFRAQLLSQESGQQFLELKRWEIKDLGYQAAKTVRESPHKLKILTELAQNFPTIAASLTKQKIDEAAEKQHYENLHKYYQPGTNLLFLNEAYYHPENLDFFKLFEKILQEINRIDNLKNLGISTDQSKTMLAPLFKSKDKEFIRFDVRNPNVFFFNDLEKEEYYARWPNSLDSLSQRGWMPQLKFIRKNLLTCLFVVDRVLSDSSRSLYEFLQMVVHGMAPFKFGLVFYVPSTGDNEGKSTPSASHALVAAVRYIMKEKGGRSAVEFLSNLDEYVEQHGETSEAVEMALKKKFKAKLSKVISDQKDLEEFIENTNNWLKEKGIHTNLPRVFLNGVPHDSDPTTIQQDLMQASFEEYDRLAALHKEKQINERSNIYDHLLSQDNVMDAYYSIIMDPDIRDLTYLPLIPNHIEELKESKEWGKLSAVEKGSKILEDVQYFIDPHGKTRSYPITHLVIGDLNHPSGIELALSSIEGFEDMAQMKSPSRVGFIAHIDSSAPQNVEPFAVIYALIQSQQHSIAWDSSMKLLSKLLDSDEENISCKEMATEILNEKQGNVAQFEKAFELLINEDQLWKNQVAFAKEIVGLHKDENAVITNGRVVILSNRFRFPRGAFRAIERIEYSRISIHMERRARQLQIPHTSSVKHTSHIADIILGASSLQGIRSVSLATSNERNMYGFPHIFRPEPASEAFVDLVAVVNPISKEAQRISPILELFDDHFKGNIKVHLHLNPIVEISEMPLESYYRYAISPIPRFDANGVAIPVHNIEFTNIPEKYLVTLGLDTPLSWLVTARYAQHDLDNIRFDSIVAVDGEVKEIEAIYELDNLVVQGSCMDPSFQAVQGLQLELTSPSSKAKTDTIVMQNYGYFQLKANPGLWKVKLKEGRSKAVYTLIEPSNNWTVEPEPIEDKPLAIHSFAGSSPRLHVNRKSTHFSDDQVKDKRDDVIHVFSLASGHLYERFLRIMMLSVIRHTKSPVKFWLLSNFLSPKFIDFLPSMAEQYGFEVELVTYQWPYWLNPQEEKQRIIWGYKILFLDVLFPLDIKRIIYVDADQIVRTDLKELMEIDMGTAPYGYVPFCDDREETLGFQFWRQGYWQNHLEGKPYHISALYVVDLERFRKVSAGDILRSNYDMLSRDKGSLANLDQDLPNYLQHQVPIYSLPQEWLWCETWCSDESKANAKTIDLCNNPLTKTPKLQNAIRIVPEWTDYDNELKLLEKRIESGNSANPTEPLQNQQQQQQETPELGAKDIL